MMMMMMIMACEGDVVGGRWCLGYLWRGWRVDDVDGGATVAALAVDAVIVEMAAIVMVIEARG